MVSTQAKGKQKAVTPRFAEPENDLDADFSDDEEQEAFDEDQDEISDDEEEDDVAGSSRAPQQHFSQYMGDSDAEMLSDSEEDDDVSGEGSAGEKEGEADEDLTELQEEMKKIPLATLLKAQKKLAKASSSKPRAPQTDLAMDARSGKQDKGDTKNRKGREAPRRQMAPALLKPRVLPPADGDEEVEGIDGRIKKKGKVKQHRDHKHAPTEMSSKRPVSRKRQVVEMAKDNRRDPRFDNLSGSFDPNQFSSSYSFLDDARKAEISTLKQTLAITRKKAGAVSQAHVPEMSSHLEKLQSKHAAVEKAKREAEAMKKWKREEQERQKTEGKGAFFLKDKERKKLVEEQRMNELSRNKRKLRKVMDRKKGKEKKKDWLSMPARRVAP